MNNSTKVSITTKDRERLLWVQHSLYFLTGRKHSQEETINWLINEGEKVLQVTRQPKQENKNA